MSPFSNVHLVWKDEFGHTCQNNVAIIFTYIPMLMSMSFGKVNKGICKLQSNGTLKKFITRCKKSNDKESPWTYLEGVTTYKFSLIIFAR
jgi:hypothetical protein